MIIIGCDIGSLFSKVIVLKDDDLAGSCIVRTSGNISDEIGGLINKVLKEADISSDSVDSLVSTGTGKEFVKDADFSEDSLTCVGAATSFYIPEIRLAVDIGGQSITSMQLNEDGEVLNFMRNDKCASGSGRFLEVMSNKLNLEIEEFDATALKSRNTVEISTQCGVFAESEVITHVNNGEPRPDIIAGICESVAKIVVAQARRFGMGEHYTLTGGVARFESVNKVVNEKISGQYHKFPFNPQLASAIGAALLDFSE